MINKLLKIIIVLITKFFKKIFFWRGYNLTIEYSKINITKNSQLNLNIGAGKYEINNFKSLDFYSKHYYPNKEKFLEERVEYNLRNDKIVLKN